MTEHTFIVTVVIDLCTPSLFSDKIGEQFPDDFQINWLRVLDTAERSQIDQRVRHQLHRIVSLLDAVKAEQQPLARVCPRQGPRDAHASPLDHGIAEPLAPTLDALAVPRLLLDSGHQASREKALAIAGRITAAIQIELGTSEVHPHLCGHWLQRLQACRSPDQGGLLDRSPRDRREDVAMLVDARDDCVTLLVFLP